MERLPEQRGEGEQEVPAQAAPAPLQSALGVDVGQPASLDAASVLALQRSAGNAAVVSALARSVQRHAQSPQSEGDRPAEGSRPQAAFRSPALLLRSKLRSGASGRATVQRAVTTSGGEWDTDKYDLLKDVDGSGTVYPAASGVRGANIELKFKSNAAVDAELIGLSQSVQSFVNATPNLTPAAATRAIPAKDAKPLNTGAGETDEGTAIDNLPGYSNPMYAVSTEKSTALDDPHTEPQWGQHGFHYREASTALKQQDAMLKDTPIRGGAQKDSRQIFEVTALATKGAQAGTYFGSVRWGWRTDGAEKFTKLPLEKVSDGVPSSTFLKAASIWNPGKSSTTGADNLDLPVPDVKVTTGPVTLHPPIPMADVALPAGTRVQVVTEWNPPMLAGKVKVVDGPSTGITGEVDPSEWPNLTAERA